MYKELKPSKELRRLIDSFWTFSGNKAPETYKILPDNCVDVIFDFTNNSVFVSGVMSNYQIRELAAESNLLGIRFKVENFSSITPLPLSETRNLRIELSQVIPTCQTTILAQINDLLTISDKVDLLENFVAELVNTAHRQHDHLILSIAEKIRIAKGSISVQHIADSNFISLRQLERRFKEYIGLSLKEYSRIIRFIHTQKAISSSPEKSLLEIAFDMGFFDHSHLAYEFKRISGENPSYFR